MRLMNKTRYAILGMLLDNPSTGYEIKSLMSRSTVYFWRESDSTIYPTLKVLAEEGKVLSEIVYVGKKKKEVFSITETGRMEFREMIRLFQERLEKVEKVHEEYKKIEERLEGIANSTRKAIRLKALKYGLFLVESEIQWLNEEKSK